MKTFRFLTALVAFAVLAGLAYVSQLSEPAGGKMTRAAEKFLASLTEDQRLKANLRFDDADRVNWQFVPRQDTKKNPLRKGLRLEEMNTQQRQAAADLLRSGTSASGYGQATTIMTLESILRELEKNGSIIRNPDWYFFTVFGSPSRSGKWAWRVEGHHLSLNFVVDGGDVVAATPAFFGANPAIVKNGPRQGLQTLPQVEDLARELVKSLDGEQRQKAHQASQFPEVAGGTNRPKVGQPKGVPAASMTQEQLAILQKLLDAYSGRLPEDIARAQMSEILNRGLQNVYFAYAGELNPGEQHTYRLQGPTFLIEFLNVQSDSAGNPANHIHSAWRNTKGDFGIH
jgi:hypothetical protein